MIGHGWVKAIAENLVNVRNLWYNMEPRDIELLMYGLEYKKQTRGTGKSSAELVKR